LQTKKKRKSFLALSFRLAVNMLQLIYALKKHNNWRFPTPSQPRISFERAILFCIFSQSVYFFVIIIVFQNLKCYTTVTIFLNLTRVKPFINFRKIFKYWHFFQLDNFSYPLEYFFLRFQITFLDFVYDCFVKALLHYPFDLFQLSNEVHFSTSGVI
jgi:hypothetical protein